jgi:hypothetical protein
MNINRLETGQALRRLLAGLIEIVGAPRREFGLSETGSLETASSSGESCKPSVPQLRSCRSGVPAMRRLCRRTPLFDRFLKLDGLVEQAESPSIVS